MGNTSVRFRIAAMVIGVTGMLVVMALLASASLGRAAAAREAAQAAHETQHIGFFIESHMYQYLMLAEGDVVAAVRAGHLDEAKDEYGELLETREHIDAHFGELEAAFASETGAALSAQAEEAHEAWLAVQGLTREYLEEVLADANVSPAAIGMTEEEETAAHAHEHAAPLEEGAHVDEPIKHVLEDRVADAEDAFSALEESIGSYTDEQFALASRLDSAAAKTILWGMIVTAAFSVIVGTLIWLSITRPLGALRVHAEAVASGQLDEKFPSLSKDEIGDVAIAIERMRDTIVTRVRNMQEMVGVVLVTAEQLGDLAEAAKKDAASGKTVNDELEDITASTDTLRGLVRQMLEEPK